MRPINVVLLCALLLGVALSQAWASGADSLFDKPLHETHTPLPRDPENPQSKPMLSCFYYPHFMVKQVDLGEMGADQLSILPEPVGQAEPRCIRTNAKGEMVIDPKTWGGYFEGVKGNFVFFTAGDGFSDGLSFAVFSGSDGAKLFEDAAKLDKDTIHFTALVALNDQKSDFDSALKLRYRRVYVAQCSLRAGERNCWSRIREMTGLAEDSPPNCALSYEALEKGSRSSAKEMDSDPSVIAYDVEVVLNLRNTAVRVVPISKAMECYPED